MQEGPKLVACYLGTACLWWQPSFFILTYSAVISLFVLYMHAKYSLKWGVNRKRANAKTTPSRLNFWIMKTFLMLFEIQFVGVESVFHFFKGLFVLWRRRWRRLWRRQWNMQIILYLMPSCYFIFWHWYKFRYYYQWSQQQYNLLIF